MRAYDKIEEPCFVCECEDKLGEERGTQSHPINCGWRVKRENEGYRKGLDEIIEMCRNSKGDTLIDRVISTAVNSIYGRYDMKDGD